MSLARSRTGSRIARLPRISLISFVGKAIAVRRQRRALEKLEDHLLDDIGVTWTDAWSETKRPFWELPERHRW